MTVTTQALLQERYLLKSILGQGGQATIFRALDQELKVERAIKALSPEGLRNKSLRERFKAEAQVMARLEHKGIVRVYDIVYGEDLLFIVMEILSGGNLWQWVKSNGRMPEKMACQAIIEIAAALQIVHEKGIVHRDIKPQNMLLNEQGEVKLTDFGIAQFNEESEPDRTMTGLIMGTMGYMSPEQKDDSKQATMRSDIYSLGACLFSLCRAKNPKPLYDKDRREDVLKDFSDELKGIIQKACHCDPDERYADAAELCAALEEIKPNLEPIPDSLITLQSQAESIAAKEDMPIDDDTMRSITERLRSDKTNPTLFFETMVQPKVDTFILDERQTEATIVETTIKTIEHRNKQMMLLICGLSALVVLVLALVMIQYFNDDKQGARVLAKQNSAPPQEINAEEKKSEKLKKVDTNRKAKQTCLALAGKITSTQKTSGGFSGISQVNPEPWDTAQQLTALQYGGACGFSSTESWKKAKPPIEKWLSSKDYPRNVLDAAWLVIALSKKDEQMASNALKWLKQFRLKDGGYGVYSRTENMHTYATVLATWGLSRIRGDKEKSNLLKAATRLRQAMQEPLDAGLDEQTWWVLTQAGKKYPELKPSKEESLALANRMIDRCQASAPGGKCTIPNWPEPSGSLPTKDGKEGSTTFLGGPWALIASKYLQKEDLPENIKTQLKAIESWVLSKRLESTPHLKQGFEMAENLIAFSLILEDLKE